MCGRFVSPGQADVEREWHLRGAEGLFTASYNVAPTMPIPIIYVDRHDDERKLAVARWGLIPFWAKGPKPPTHTFNARLEDAPGKPMWRQPFRTARCIIPAAGWYEWQTREAIDQLTGEFRTYKQPYFMHLPEQQLVGFAGLMSWTRAEGSDIWAGSCAVLTTAATGVAASVHHRMPVVLASSAHAAWMDPALTDPDQINGLIAESPIAGAILNRAVSTRVNGSRIDDVGLIEPILI